jgi:hypothetical protein
VELPVKFPRDWLIAAVFLLPRPLHCGPLSFGEALQLALSYHASSAPATLADLPPAGTGDARTAGQAAMDRPCPVHLQDYTGLAAQLASANEFGPFPADPFLSGHPGPASAGLFDLRSRKNVILCTALVYAIFEGTHAQMLVLREQQTFVDRLLDIESKRVFAEVDHPLRLTQAKLMRARVRLMSEALEASGRDARTALSAIVGVSLDETDPVGNSMPLLPDNFTTSVEDRRALRELIAYRDVVQLDYVSGFINRLKVTHDMALAKASIGELVAAHIEEGMKLIALLHVNDHIRAAKIQFLGASDRLESWSAGIGTSNAGGIQSGSRSPDADLTHLPGQPVSGAQTPSLLSVLLTPAIKELPVGKPQQFSATATYSDGHAGDITSDANWSCSTDTGAILSTTGLLTGVSAGPVTIHVQYQGIERSRRVSVTARPVDEYLLPGH